MTPRVWLPKLDSEKSGGGRSAPTGIRRSGEAAYFAAQPEWLMTRGAGRQSRKPEKKSIAGKNKHRKNCR